MRFFGATEKATYLKRPNRFTLVCRLNGRVVKAFLPNPGRLWELLLPGVLIYLEKSSQEKNLLPYTAVAIQRGSHPVMVHTHRTNDFVAHLLGKGLVPGLEKAEVIKREFVHGKSRFDFLLRNGGTEVILEVKSCTLFGKRVAMFPDAITARGRRHVEELLRISREGKSAAVLFLICWPDCDYFMPEYHTDLEFSLTLMKARHDISIIPLAVEIGENLSLTSRIRKLEIPWETVKKEAEDRGSYMLILRLPERRNIEIGNLGNVDFRAGYYVYAGSAMKNLSRRVERHRRTGKNLFWHVDYLRAYAEYHCALPIRTHDDLECKLAAAVKNISEWEIPRFGSSDCSCDSHLFGMRKDPFLSPEFIALLQYFRMDRLFEGNRF